MCMHVIYAVHNGNSLNLSIRSNFVQSLHFIKKSPRGLLLNLRSPKYPETNMLTSPMWK